MIGRERELAALEHHLAELRGGPRVLAVAGEPGIGKTLLLDALAARARARGWLVLTGRALEFESAVPYAPFVDALDDDVDPRALARLPDDILAELARVYPPIEERSAPALPAERYRLHRATRALLNELARGRSLVLILDDMHWADEASLELLTTLVRRPPAARLLLAVAYRPAQAPAALAAELPEAIELEPLTEVQTITLLEDLDPARAAAIHGEAGGNPFYAEQLARSDRPASVAAAIEREVAGLDDAARTLLRAAAVLGDPFDPALAAEVARVPGDGLSRLVARDLVRPVGPRFAFRHPIVRSAVYAAAQDRAELHARAARALDSPLARAHHLERSARPGDTAAASALESAAGLAAPRAPATAARWYEAALALQSEPNPETLVALAHALAACGRIESARERVEQALALQPAGGRARLVALGAGLDLMLGRHAEAHARLVAAWEDEPPGRTRTALAVELAIQPGYAYRPSAASDRAARSLAELEREPAARAALAIRSTLLGDIRAAAAHADVAAALVDAGDDHQLIARPGPLHHLGGAELFLDRYEDCVRHLTRGLSLARAAGAGQYQIQMLSHLAIAQALLGVIPVARSTAQDARDTDGPPSLRLWAAIYAGLVELEAGDAHAADAIAREADELARGLPPSSFTAKARALLATTTLEQGEPERALVLFEESGIAELQLHDAAVRATYWEPLTRALLAAGRRDAAARLLDDADRAVAALGLALPRAHARRARARLLLADGEPARAAELARLAAVDADGPGAVVEAAAARALAGRALAAVGDVEAAVAELQHAHRTFAECGADGRRDAAASDLRRLGRRVARPRRALRGAPVGSLSGRERQIARLVADGLTNQQIADELHLSAKTVEMHLTRSYAKLGIGRRAALARILADAESR